MLEGTLEVKFHATRPRLLSEGYGARKKGEWSELNTDRDGGNGGHPQRLPQPANYLALYYPLRACSQAVRTVLKNAMRVLYVTSITRYWGLGTQVQRLFSVFLQKGKFFPTRL